MFWIEKLTCDGFRLPNDILELATVWKKKNQTPVQFLMSFYAGIELVIINLFEEINSLSDLTTAFKDYETYPEINETLQRLSAQFEQRKKEILHRERDIITLLVSSGFVGNKQAHVIHLPVHVLRSLDKLSLTEVLGILKIQPLSPDQIAFHMADPFNLAKDKINELQGQKKSQTDEEEDDEDLPELLTELPNIQEPGMEFFRGRWEMHLEILFSLVKESNILILEHSQVYLIYQQDGTLKLKSVSGTMLPEEILPILKQRRLSSRRDIKTFFPRFVCYSISIPGKGVFELGNDPELFVEFEGHKIFGKMSPADSTRCQWVSRATATRTGGQCERKRCEDDPYFCLQHARACTKGEQILRIKKDQGLLIEEEVSEEDDE
jgi:hypothetical protein